MACPRAAGPVCDVRPHPWACPWVKRGVGGWGEHRRWGCLEGTIMGPRETGRGPLACGLRRGLPRRWAERGEQAGLPPYLSRSGSRRSPLGRRTGRPRRHSHTGLRAGRGWSRRRPPLENTQRVGPSRKGGVWGREERTAGRRERRSLGAEARREGQWAGPSPQTSPAPSPPPLPPKVAAALGVPLPRWSAQQGMWGCSTSSLIFQRPRLCMWGPLEGAPTCLTVDSNEACRALADIGPREVPAGASISAEVSSALIPLCTEKGCQGCCWLRSEAPTCPQDSVHSRGLWSPLPQLGVTTWDMCAFFHQPHTRPSSGGMPPPLPAGKAPPPGHAFLQATLQWEAPQGHDWARLPGPALPGACVSFSGLRALARYKGVQGSRGRPPLPPLAGSTDQVSEAVTCPL